MARLKVQELAKARGLNISQLQLKAGVAMGTVRRYWYGTRDGKEAGPKLTEVDLDILSKIAQALDVRLLDLIEEADWLPPALAALSTRRRTPGQGEVVGVVPPTPALHS